MARVSVDGRVCQVIKKENKRELNERRRSIMTGLLEVTLKRWHFGARVDVIYQHSHQFVLKTYEEQQQKQQLRTTTKKLQN